MFGVFITHLTTCVSFPVRLRSIEVAMFPDLSSYFCEYNVITADKNDDYTNRTYGVIKPESNFRYREFVGITGLF